MHNLILDYFPGWELDFLDILLNDIDVDKNIDVDKDMDYVDVAMWGRALWSMIAESSIAKN